MCKSSKMRKDISKRINGARSDRKQLSKLSAVLTKGDIDCHRAIVTAQVSPGQLGEHHHGVTIDADVLGGIDN
jgi:hypothetical protein